MYQLSHSTRLASQVFPAKAVDLSPTGDARLHPMSVVVAVDLTPEDFDIFRPFRSRSSMRLIWPRSTLMSWGSSSSDVRPRNIPRRVRRSSPSTPPGPTSRRTALSLTSACESISLMVRNLSISKLVPSRPIRSWRKKIGRPRVSRIARAMPATTGKVRRRSVRATRRSTTYLTWMPGDVGEL